MVRPRPERYPGHPRGSRGDRRGTMAEEQKNLTKGGLTKVEGAKFLKIAEKLGLKVTQQTANYRVEDASGVAWTSPKTAGWRVSPNRARPVKRSEARQDCGSPNGAVPMSRSVSSSGRSPTW